MKSTRQMTTTHPSPTLDSDLLTEFIDSAFDCAQACTACADACLAEEMVAELRHCIRTDLDCADVTAATGRVASRQTQPSPALLRAQVEACAVACKACGDECEQHASKHEHCRACAEACRRCEEACRRLIGSLPA